MASLLVLKGGTPGQRLPLDKAIIILGREVKDCDFVIANQAVSRVHAQISFIDGRHFIEDLKSRNKTYVNNQLVETRTALNDNDRIKICDFLATFHADSASDKKTPIPPHLRGEGEEEEHEADGPSTVQATLSRLPQHQLLEAQPADRLRALLEISNSLAQTLELDQLLEKIADVLLTTFRQADRCFIILSDDAGHLIPRVIKLRRPTPDASPRFSRTIVRNCLDSMQAFLSEDASTDSKFSLSQSITDFRILSVMCAPMVAGEKAFGVIQLDSQDRSKKFNQDDLKLLLGVANQASVAFEMARLHEDLIQRERTQRDVELGQQVQRSFLPQRLPEVLGYQFYAHYNAALTIGGDYYDFIPFPDGKFAVLLGDVAGKGVPAALLMAKFSAEARSCMLMNSDPARAITCLNNVLWQIMQAGDMDRFVTIAATVLDPINHRVTIVNAGHMTPLIFRRKNKTLEDAVPNDQTGLPLGIMESNHFEATHVELQSGDSLILYTDGVSDAVSTQNASFSTAGIRKAVLDTADNLAESTQPEALGRAVIEAVGGHAAGRAQHDDIALVCFGRLDGSSSVSTLPERVFEVALQSIG
jgi:serine phosphatase RsbU (regulator of sigma subunit)/pSer/pThr/pTyr-binding forkhead associated (FHA) protein